MDYVNRATGATKEQIGKALGNQELETEGRNQRAQAMGEQQIKNAEGRAARAAEQGRSAMNQAGDKAKDLRGGIKEQVGEAIGSQRIANKGRLDQAEAAVKESSRGQQ